MIGDFEVMKRILMQWKGYDNFMKQEIMNIKPYQSEEQKEQLLLLFEKKKIYEEISQKN
jgi:hypothetical protein